MPSTLKALPEPAGNRIAPYIERTLTPGYELAEGGKTITIKVMGKDTQVTLPADGQSLKPGQLALKLTTASSDKDPVGQLRIALSRQVKLIKLDGLKKDSTKPGVETLMSYRRNPDFHYVGFHQKGCIKGGSGCVFNPSELYSKAAEVSLEKYEAHLAKISNESYVFHSLAMRILLGDQLLLGDWKGPDESHSAIVKKHLIGRVVKTITMGEARYPWTVPD